MTRGTSLLIVLLAFSASSALPQVAARQGEASKQNSTEFKSPMILEASLKDFGQLPMETGRDFREFQQFYCDDLNISRLLISKKPGKRGGVILAIVGSVKVRPSYDRLATLVFEFLNGEQKVALARIPGINAEEGKIRTFSTKLPLDAEQYRALTDPAETALLRVTVNVVDND